MFVVQRLSPGSPQGQGFARGCSLSPGLWPQPRTLPPCPHAPPHASPNTVLGSQSGTHLFIEQRLTRWLMMEEETKEPELKVPMEGGLGGNCLLGTNESWRGSDRRPLREPLTPAQPAPSQSAARPTHPCGPPTVCRPPAPSRTQPLWLEQDCLFPLPALGSQAPVCEGWSPLGMLLQAFVLGH